MSSYCRPCLKLRRKEWRAAHPERASELKRAARRRAADRRRLGATATSATCNYCGETKPASEFHRDAKRASGLSSRCKTCRSSWVRSHHELFADYAQQHRLKALGQDNLRPDRQAIYEREGGRCHICGKAVPRDDFHLEHLWPVAKGGTNHPSNLAIAHPHCNRSKHASTQPVQQRLA